MEDIEVWEIPYRHNQLSLIMLSYCFMWFLLLPTMATQEHLVVIFVIERNLEKKLWQNIFFHMMYVCSSHFTQSFHKERTKEYIFFSALVHIIIIINLQVLESAQVEAWRESENAWSMTWQNVASTIKLWFPSTWKWHSTKFYNFTNSSTWRKACVCFHTLLVDP